MQPLLPPALCRPAWGVARGTWTWWSVLAGAAASAWLALLWLYNTSPKGQQRRQQRQQQQRGAGARPGMGAAGAGDTIRHLNNTVPKGAPEAVARILMVRQQRASLQAWRCFGLKHPRQHVISRGGLQLVPKGAPTLGQADQQPLARLDLVLNMLPTTPPPHTAGWQLLRGARGGSGRRRGGYSARQALPQPGHPP